MQCEHEYFPNGKLGILTLESFRDTGKKVDAHLKQMREEEEESYIIPIEEVRFSNGEGKIRISKSVRGKDIYILCDVGNYGCTYNMFGNVHHKSPDEHFQDIKRVISAIDGKAKRVTLIMPLLYASRQHKRKGRESLDCAVALQELARLGVNTILTFDAHDPTVQNAIPLISFENFYPTYTMMKHFVTSDNGICIDKEHLIVVSPDTGAMDRAIYYASVLGLDVGMFYKRRDYTKIVNGKNPIVQHEFLGADVANKNVLVVDDMIASGESILDIAQELKKRKANKIYVNTTFAFFTEGVQKFEEFYRNGMIEQVYSTNLSYTPEYIVNAEWFTEIDMSKYIAKIINTLNFDRSLSPLLNATDKIKQLLAGRSN